jgi:hypothetical protein
MQKHEETEFKEVMIGLGEYYGKEISEALTKIYWYDLKPLTIEQFKQAASQHRLNPDNGQFFPKSADIVKVFTGNSKQQEQRLDDTAQMQWLVVLSEMRRIGSHGTLKIEDHQAMAAVKALGGWRFICSQTEAQLVWQHKEFIAAYKNFERTDISLLPNKLAGRIELENHKKNKQPSIEFARIEQGIKQYRLDNKERN